MDKLTPEEQANLDEETLNAQIAEEEAEKLNQKAKVAKEHIAKVVTEKQKSVLDEKKTYNIKVIVDTPHLKKDAIHTVSGNVANILINRGIAEVA